LLDAFPAQKTINATVELEELLNSTEESVEYAGNK
jgi:hypothetical protein